MRYVFVTVIVIVGFISIITMSTKRNNHQDKIIVGYCPTMAQYTKSFGTRKYEFTLLSTASEVMHKFNTHEIDIALIGRRAYSFEKKNDTQEYILKDGYTLISAESKTIHKDDLQRYTIHTAIKRDIAYLLPSSTSVIYYATTDAAIQAGLTDAVLINWTEYQADYNLLVPVINNQKVNTFRTPIIYFTEKFKRNAEEFQVII